MTWRLTYVRMLEKGLIKGSLISSPHTFCFYELPRSGFEPPVRFMAHHGPSC